MWASQKRAQPHKNRSDWGKGTSSRTNATKNDKTQTNLKRGAHRVLQAESATRVSSYASRSTNETVPDPPRKTMLGRREGLLSGPTPPLTQHGLQPGPGTLPSRTGDGLVTMRVPRDSSRASTVAHRWPGTGPLSCPERSSAPIHLNCRF